MRLKVSPSGYRHWREYPISIREQRDQALVIHLRQIHRECKSTYGYRRMYHAARLRGLNVGRNRVHRLMRIHGIMSRYKRKYKTTTDSRHVLPVASNLLNRQFNVNTPNQVWVSDITYIPTQEGWLYLATTLDLYSRKIVGWAMDERMQKGLVIRALQMALHNRQPSPLQRLMHPSDRGSQYASKLFQKLLKVNDIRCSMSRKGNCWDNAVAESFFRTLKEERVHQQRYKTRDDAKQSIFEYIEVFYNQKRLHSSLGYMSPDQFERVA
jgi:putative transposase